jgi:hypothetical protein
MTKPEGWRNKRPDDPKRHSDAARGIESGHLSEVKSPIYPSVPKSTFHSEFPSQKVKLIVRIHRRGQKQIEKTELIIDDEEHAREKFREERKALGKLAEDKKVTNFYIELIGQGEANKWGGRLYNSAVWKDNWSYDDPDVELKGRIPTLSEPDKDDDEELEPEEDED